MSNADWPPGNTAELSQNRLKTLHTVAYGDAVGAVSRLFLTLSLFPILSFAALRADDWPQWGGPQRDIVWRETGLVEKLPNEGGLLPRKWATKIGDGYAGPAVAAGKVYVMDYLPEERVERFLCLDAETGDILWKHTWPTVYSISYPAGPRCTPTVDGDRVYGVGAMGDLFCFNVASGDVIWKKNYVDDFGTTLPIWGMVPAPLIDGDQAITLVGGEKNALVVSFDKRTGAELWRALEDAAVGYSPPVIYEHGNVRQVILWHPAAVSALDPKTGEVQWEVPFYSKAGLTAPMARQSGNRIFVTAFYNGPLMLEVAPDGKSAQVVWRGKSSNERQPDGLHSIMPTPIVTPDHIYGVCSYGQLRGLDAKTGEQLWETFEATGNDRWWNAFLIPHEDRVFIHNEQGDLIIARLSPEGYEEISRAKLIEPTRPVNRRKTIWSHPAFAMKSVFARNDGLIIRVDLSGK